MLTLTETCERAEKCFDRREADWMKVKLTPAPQAVAQGGKRPSFAALPAPMATAGGFTGSQL